MIITTANDRPIDPLTDTLGHCVAWCGAGNQLFFIETSALADSNVATAFETILKGSISLIDCSAVCNRNEPSD